MEILQAIVRGVVQGITEFLPISSSAHLILIPWFLGWEDMGLAFDAALHFGTLLSLLWFFRAQWLELARSGLRLVAGRGGPGDRMPLFILAATVPGALAGLLAEDIIATWLRNPIVPAFTLIGLALVLLAAERTGTRSKDFLDISWPDAIVIGLAQALALVPGVSRSGVTITAGLFRGLQREPAARFSFLLSTPIIAGAAAKTTLDMVTGGLTSEALATLAAGVAASAVVGYLAIRFMLRYLATNTTYVFIWYRIGLGVVVLLAIWRGFG